MQAGGWRQMRAKRLETTCTQELFIGFFGMDANGTQPECGATNTIDVEYGDYTKYEDGYAPLAEHYCISCKAPLIDQPWYEE
jgi:hypothetical protein